nr:YodL domain-containing protein [Hungatella effluvii]
MSYSRYDRDKLEAADTMRIERTIYFEAKKTDISTFTALTVEQLQAMREESAAAEQAIFENLQAQAAAWEEQAGKTLFLDKAIEYARTPAAEHTANQWEQPDEYRHVRSNMVYKMDYRISENTRYDKASGQSIPYSYTLSWSVRTNSPDGYNQAKIAGQDKKVFADKAAMEKYLNGRIKAYSHLFTELSPPIPPEYAQHFRVNGVLLPGYTVEGEEPEQPGQNTRQAETTPAEQAAEPDTGQRKEREEMNKPFEILIDSRTRFETGEPGGVWLPMPATAGQLHNAMESIGVTADNPQDFFINGIASSEDCPFDVPLEVIQRGSVDELNYLGKLLEMQGDGDREKFTAAVTHGAYAGNLKDLINLAQNLDCYWLYPTVHSEADYGVYLIDELDELELPEEAKKYFKYEEYGHDAVSRDKGIFTGQGYIYQNENTFTEWYGGRDVPEEYRIMSYPQPPQRPDPEKADLEAAPAGQAALTAEPPEPKPVTPIILNAEKPAEKLKEITDRLEQGISELFESDRYKEYLSVMSKFHNYSFNNTVLIAMQKPDATLVMGYNAWKDKAIGRHVKKDEKGIKIIAPSPFKVKKQMEKIDPKTQRPIIGRDGKPVTEEKEVTIPAFKVVSVFDVSQTEGRELPNLAVDALTGDVDKYRDFFAALEKTSPVPVGFEKIVGGAHGYYHLEEERIALNEGESQLQSLKTLIHEIAHAKLHSIDLNIPLDEQPNRPDRRTREVEAESIAYTVCQHYGLDTSDYSFGYVAGWSSGKELTELKNSLETIRRTAAEIIGSVDGHLAELQKTQDREQTAGQEVPAPENAPEQKTPIRETAAASEKPAFSPETIYRVRKDPYSDRRENSYLLQAYVTQENGRAKMGDVLFTGTPEKCRELMGKLETGELTQGQIKELYAKAQEPEQTAHAFDMPDPTISMEEMQGYGYSYTGMLPLREAAAWELFEKEDMQVYCLYEDGSETAVESAVELHSHAEKNGIFGVEKDDWNALSEYRAMRQGLNESEAAKEALLFYGKNDTYGIYQLTGGDKTRDFRFEPYDRLQAAGLAVDKGNYQLVYTAPLTPDMNLEGIFEKFNLDHPKDFKGHSLSISDVIVLHQNGQDTAHYVDSGAGFRQVPEFLREPQKELAPDNYLTGEKVTTPRGSFRLTSMSREQMEAAGYGFHHQSEDGKHFIMGNGTQAFAVAAEQPENYLKTAEQTTEQSYDMIDGQINNTPTVDELEAKVKAGEQISLTDLAAAIKTDREKGKEAEPGKKPSIRAQLKADKERAKKKPTKNKSQDLERS